MAKPFSKNIAPSMKTPKKSKYKSDKEVTPKKIRECPRCPEMMSWVSWEGRKMVFWCSYCGCMEAR